MVKKIEGEKFRLIVSLLLIIFFMAFILISVTYQIGLIYLILNMVCLNVVIFWEHIPKRRPERKLFSFQKDWFFDLLWGIAIGVGVIFLMATIPGFAMAAPSKPAATAFPRPLATVGQWITQVGAAPLVEEIAFRTVLFGLLYIVLGLHFFWSTMLNSLAFAIFHIKVYAGIIALSPILAVSGALIAAFLVSVLICYVNKLRGSVTTGMGIHGTINTYITSAQTIYLG